MLRSLFGLSERMAPALGGRHATRLWLTVPPMPPVPPEPEGGEPFAVRVGGGTVRGASFGSGPLVYLMHGWGGVGGQLSALVDPLRRAGFRVVMFDAPSHGRSDPGACGPGRTHGVEFAAALTAVMSRFGQADTVIAHSMGAVPSLMVNRDGRPVGRFVLLAPMRDLSTHLDRFAAQVGIGRRTRLAMDERIARLTGHPVAAIDVRLLARDAAPVPLLVVHDRGDRETWHAHTVELAESWPGPATMVSTEGLGHRRLLIDPAVVRQVVEFVGVPADRSRPGVIAA
ncbi:MAG TPA: alpha/beta fold hydrolase [Nakamurella sp.]